MTGSFGHVVYLNFGGGVLTWSAVNNAPRNVSNINNPQVISVVPPFIEDIALSPTQPTRAAVIDSIKAHFEQAYASFDVQVVTQRPPIAAFTMVMIGGAMSDIGQPTGALGIAATQNCSTPSDLDSAFVASAAGDRFSMSNDPAKEIAHVAVHEVGHTFGLVHSTDAQGTYMTTGNADAWGTGPVTPVGSYTCGRTQQDDVAILTANVGLHVPRDPVPPPSDTTPPTLQVVSLADGATLNTSYQPCVQASGDSDIAFVMMQLIAQLSGTEYVIQQDYRLSPPYRFAGLEPVAGAPLFLRFVAVDTSDNVTERRVPFSFGSPGPASPTCP